MNWLDFMARILLSILLGWMLGTSQRVSVTSNHNPHCGFI